MSRLGISLNVPYNYLTILKEVSMDDNEYTVETADLAEELIDQAIADIRLLEIDDDVIAGTLAVKSVLLRLRQGVSATEIVEEI